MKSILLALCLSLFSVSAFAGPVNINTADASTLAENLSGVGEITAKAIVAYRKKNGKFKSADELLNVKGIGEKTLKKNRKDILLSSKKAKSK